ncbi:hypothetical protein BC827DRAFT_1160938 [Russula dissimulans]|nr:hypothetical protein BC827DRAFT_1160938 [Russula dissimulans]
MHIQFPHQDAPPSLFLPQDAILVPQSCNLAHNWECSACTPGSSCPPSPSPVSSPPSSPASSDASTSEFDASTSGLDVEQDYVSYTQRGHKMPKRRTSLQSILIPPFLSYPFSNAPSDPPQPSSHARLPSTSSFSPHNLPPAVQPPETAALESSRRSPPPTFLHDDDPFANYTSARPLPVYRSGPTSPSHSRRTSVRQPRSPLAIEPLPLESPSPSSSQPVHVQNGRLPSNPPPPPSPWVSPPSPPVGGRQLRPAYTRPAFAPRPSLPSLHTLAQSDFVYPIKARKGTLGARLPLEPWDVGAGRERLSEEAPSPQGIDHATAPLHLSEESMLGPEPSIGGNEDFHTGYIHADSVDAWSHTDTHAQDVGAPLLQPPISLESGPEDDPHMFASLFDVLSTFSSSSSSSSSSVSVLSPDQQTQWGGDSPSRSPNRSSSEESVPADLSFDDDDVEYPSSKAFHLDHLDPPDIDFLSMPGSFSIPDTFQPGTSAGTIRPPINSLISDGASTHSDEDWSNYTGYATPELDEEQIFDDYLNHVEEIVDGIDQENRTNRRDEHTEGRQSSNRHGSGGQDGRQSNAGGFHGNGRGSAGDGRRGGDDGRRKDERHWRAPSAFSTPSDTESEESEQEGTRQLHPNTQGEVSSSGDDVPLAQSIPTALRAQRTIRQQVRDEKDERRRLRALQRQQQQQQQQPLQPRPQTHKQTLSGEELRPHVQASPQVPSQFTSSSSHTTRLRTKTLPSNTSRPVVAEDLARRLRDIQESNALSTSHLNKRELSSESPSHSDQLGRRSGDHARLPNLVIPDKTLRPMRSFHRPRTADSSREQPMPLPPLAGDAGRLGRSATTASRPVKQRDPFEIPPRTTPGSLPRSTRRPRTSDDTNQPSVAPLHPPVFQHASHASVSRTPVDAPDPSPLPPGPPKEIRQVSWQQRVFIVDLQRFNTIMMSPMTTAKDVIDALEAQGQLSNWVGIGGWMLFEVSQDFGMERPIREFETVSDIINSWDKNKSVNLLVAKKTPLSSLLHPSAIPSSSPMFSTYVEWESKPRKWNKRWLELREQGLWLSKKDNGKDGTFLCSLANFDAYVVTRIHKSPKPYVFAVKSTDNFSLFENAADYVHVFCCSEKDGKRWLESVLLARSYVIHQERNMLLVGPPSGSGGTPSKPLSRSGTRKGTRGAQQPLLNISSLIPPVATASQPYTFEPGSLLAKR